MTTRGREGMRRGLPLRVREPWSYQSYTSFINHAILLSTLPLLFNGGNYAGF